MLLEAFTHGVTLSDNLIFALLFKPLDFRIKSDGLPSPKMPDFTGVSPQAWDCQKNGKSDIYGGLSDFLKTGCCGAAKIELVPEAAQGRFWRTAGIGKGVSWYSFERS